MKYHECDTKMGFPDKPTSSQRKLAGEFGAISAMLAKKAGVGQTVVITCGEVSAQSTYVGEVEKC